MAGCVWKPALRWDPVIERAWQKSSSSGLQIFLGLIFLETGVAVRVCTRGLGGTVGILRGSNPRAPASRGAALPGTEKKEQPPLQRAAVVELSFTVAKTFWGSALWSKPLIPEQFFIYIYIKTSISKKHSALKKKGVILNVMDHNKDSSNNPHFIYFFQHTKIS